MAVIRVEKTKNYTVMSNYHLRDKNLSLKAKGLLSYMLSLPDDWDYSVRGLVACLKEGKDGIQAALHELEKYGYLQRGQGRTGSGKLDKAVYTITELPLTENPHTGKPLAGKPPQLNTNGLSTNKRSTNPIEEEEAEWQEVLKCYQNNIRPVCGSLDLEKLSSLHKDFGKEWVLAGIDECVSNNVRNFNYLTTILERWKAEGFRKDNRKKRKPVEKKDTYTPEGYKVKWFN